MGGIIMSIIIDSWCSECSRDVSKRFFSLKKVKMFKCKVCGQEQYACNLCDMMNITYCGDKCIPDGGCIFLYEDGSIRDKAEYKDILFKRQCLLFDRSL